MTTGICRLKSEHVKTLFRDGSPRLTSFTHVMRVGASVRLQGSPVPGWVALPLTCGR